MPDISIIQQTQILYTVSEAGNDFVDAIYIPADQPIDNDQIAAEIQLRYQKWQDTVDIAQTELPIQDITDALITES